MKNSNFLSRPAVLKNPNAKSFWLAVLAALQLTSGMATCVDLKPDQDGKSTFKYLELILVTHQQKATELKMKPRHGACLLATVEGYAQGDGAWSRSVEPLNKRCDGKNRSSIQIPLRGGVSQQWNGTNDQTVTVRTTLSSLNLHLHYVYDTTGGQHYLMEKYCYADGS